MNILLGYFAGRPELPPAEIVRSLEILANRAHNRLQGGWDELAVRRQWPYAYEDSIHTDGGSRSGHRWRGLRQQAKEAIAAML